MSKKVAIIGKGTAGVFSLIYVLTRTDWDIEWYFDNNIKAQAVGEGTNLIFPSSLCLNLGMNHFDFKQLFDSTHKESIYKKNWGNTVEEFHHYFAPPYVALHFNAVKFQEHIFNTFQNNPRIKYLEKNITHDQIDADYIVDSSGKPEFDDNLLYKSKYIPVNSVHVNQCLWDYPRFQYTLTIARPYGWVFGIPLTNRCSIGYLYDNKINTLEEIKEDVKNVLEEYNLTPSGITNTFTFGNYYRKNNFTERVVYNGNASFFLEPLEATSIGLMDVIQNIAFDIWSNIINVDQANNRYHETINEIETMIMLHYFAGSPFKTKFWNEAENKGKLKMENIKNDPNLIYMIRNSDDDFVRLLRTDFSNEGKFYGTWGLASFKQNIDKLGIRSKLEKFLS